MSTTKSKSKVCTCVDKVNEKLKDYNTILSKTLILNFTTGKANTNISIATEKIDVKKRGKAKTVLATYCPFCGINLQK